MMKNVEPRSELQAGRVALEAGDLAQGTNETLQQLRNPVHRLPRPREPIPNELLEEAPRSPFILQNVRKARKDVAVGPSGMTSEHIRVLLDIHGTLICSSFLENNCQSKRLDWGDSLHSENDGGVRGIVAGDVTTVWGCGEGGNRSFPARSFNGMRVCCACLASNHRIGPECDCVVHQRHWYF